MIFFLSAQDLHHPQRFLAGLSRLQFSLSLSLREALSLFWKRVCTAGRPACWAGLKRDSNRLVLSSSERRIPVQGYRIQDYGGGLALSRSIALFPSYWIEGGLGPLWVTRIMDVRCAICGCMGRKDSLCYIPGLESCQPLSRTCSFVAFVRFWFHSVVFLVREHLFIILYSSAPVFVFYI